MIHLPFTQKVLAAPVHEDYAYMRGFQQTDVISLNKYFETGVAIPTFYDIGELIAHLIGEQSQCWLVIPDLGAQIDQNYP